MHVMECKYWSYRASSVLTPAMQAHLWAAFVDLRQSCVPDSERGNVWRLSLGRRGVMEREEGDDSDDDHPDEETLAQEATTAGPSRNPASANSRFPRVSPGTLQRLAPHPPQARAAALRFMATLDLILGGGGEYHRDRQDMGVFKGKPPARSVAEAWGGWGGCEDQPHWSPRDTLAELDRASLRTATLTRILPDADGSKEVDRGELQAAADAVKARCGVPEDVDVHPFRFAGLGTMVTVEVGVDDSYKIGSSMDPDCYAYFINLRRPPSRPTDGVIDCCLPQLGMRIPITSDSVLALRAGCQVHYFTANMPKRRNKKKKNKKKKKAITAAAAAEDEQEEHDEHEHDDDDEEHSGGASTPGVATPGRSTPGPSSARPSSAGPLSYAGPSYAGPSSAGPSYAGSSSAGPSYAGPSHAGPSSAGSSKASSSSAGLSLQSLSLGGPSGSGSSSAGPYSSAGPSSSSAGPSRARHLQASSSSSSAVASSSSKKAQQSQAGGSSSGASALSTTNPPVKVLIADPEKDNERVIITIWSDEATLRTIESVAEMVFGPPPPGWVPYEN